MSFNNKCQFIFFILGITTVLFLLSSCGSDEEMIVDPCDNIELNGNTLEFKGETYNISEYNYSTLVGIDHNFSFKAFDASCTDSLDIFLRFTKVISFPNFSLECSFTTTFDTQMQTFEEMSGNFRFAGGTRQSILSGGTARIESPNDDTYRIFIDAATGALGSDGDVLQLDVIVPRE